MSGLAPKGRNYSRPEVAMATATYKPNVSQNRSTEPSTKVHTARANGHYPGIITGYPREGLSVSPEFVALA